VSLLSPSSVITTSFSPSDTKTPPKAVTRLVYQRQHTKEKEGDKKGEQQLFAFAQDHTHQSNPFVIFSHPGLGCLRKSERERKREKKSPSFSTITQRN
jgi:hypothetical protein